MAALGSSVIIKEYSIGICVRYADNTYTLAIIRFEKNGDVVVTQPIGKHQQLEDGTKFNPHITYHQQGIHQLVSYREHHHRKEKQPLDTSFSGHENLIRQGFSRETARRLDYPCKAFDTCLNINSIDIDLKEEVVQKKSGKVRTPLPTSTFQVDLIEPGRGDLIPSVITSARKIIRQELVKDSFPWCLVTITG